MTNADLIEMEWLAATLATTSTRLQRAAALLRAAGDLERLQAKLSAIAADRDRGGQVRPGAPPGRVADRPAAIAAERESGSPTMPVGASRVGAVFDPPIDARLKVGKNNAGASRPPF